MSVTLPKTTEIQGTLKVPETEQNIVTVLVLKFSAGFPGSSGSVGRVMSS